MFRRTMCPAKCWPKGVSFFSPHYRSAVLSSTATPGGDPYRFGIVLVQQERDEGSLQRGVLFQCSKTVRRRPRAPNHLVGYRFGIVL